MMIPKWKQQARGTEKGYRPWRIQREPGLKAFYTLISTFD